MCVGFRILTTDPRGILKMTKLSSATGETLDKGSLVWGSELFHYDWILHLMLDSGPEELECPHMAPSLITDLLIPDGLQITHYHSLEINIRSAV